MKKIIVAVAMTCATALTAAAANAQTVVNNPDLNAWNIYGAQVQRLSDAAVAGGSAIEATIANTPVNPWDAAAGSNITSPIHKGDRLHVSVLLKGKSLSGNPNVNLDMVIQVNASPYGPIGAGKALTLTQDWQTFELDTVADQDYAPNATALVVHLATGKQVVDLGPVTITDLGQ